MCGDNESYIKKRMGALEAFLQHLTIHTTLSNLLNEISHLIQSKLREQEKHGHSHSISWPIPFR